jgi:AraC-like DNA-binding protein
MKIKSLNEQISVWRLADFPGLELRRGIAVSQPYPKHWHEEFHFCLIQAGGRGSLHYRGARHITPAGSLFIVHPGEVHSNEPEQNSTCTFRNLYVAPDLVCCAATELATRTRTLPFFATTTLFDRAAIKLYLQLHESLELGAAKLEQEELLLGFLTTLIARYATPHCKPAEPGCERAGVNRVRAYLTDNLVENVSLEMLAAIARLSPFHLNRVFSREFGMPPHAFQTQLRVARAQSLLRQGASITQAALEVGFVDQSHFTRHFRRLVGITPGHYRQASNNVQARVWPFVAASAPSG